ncbi:serine/arginine-rich splicing factor 4-like [Cololabis saira]|uniref:serine/arginine-rich splicing factor 4-like n=1 Tax=Cololabis saira TaxID=129043 RepID=UPI002AD218E5|nr:serine/arginine-rich splicing factor 4-like [Cololabis saira]
MYKDEEEDVDLSDSFLCDPGEAHLCVPESAERVIVEHTKGPRRDGGYGGRSGYGRWGGRDRGRRNEGVIEFRQYSDMKRALEKLDGTEVNGRKIRLIEDRPGAKRRRSYSRSRSRSRSRGRRSHKSRSDSSSRSRSHSKKSKSKSKKEEEERSNGAQKDDDHSRSRSPKSKKDGKKGKRDSQSRSRSRSHSRSRSRSRSRSEVKDRSRKSVSKTDDQPFKLAVDASDTGVGAVLLQEGADGVEHSVSYFSKKLDRHQKW